jgi:hypothetical protein
LAQQLQRPGYHINRSNKLVLGSKQDMVKRGEASPDDADALALTFAQAVAPPKNDSFGRIVEDVLLLDQCSKESDWTAGVICLPLW